MRNISAEPMPSRISLPAHSSHSSASLGGRASPADSDTRTLERSTSAMRGDRSMWLMSVGTFVRNVGRCAAIWSNSSSAVERPGKSTAVAPTANGNIRFVPVA